MVGANEALRNAADQRARGFYSLLRWRTDAIRDESRNVAVIVVEERGARSGFKPAPISSVSSRLREQGLLDAALQGLENQVIGSAPFTPERLHALRGQLGHSLYLTEPRPVALKDDVDGAVRALYKALVAPRGGGSSRVTKSVVLDKVVNGLRRDGYGVRRGAYVGDFIFDAVLDTADNPRVIEVLSFAAPRKDWAPIERDAGHFLFALRELSMRGSAVIAPPKQDAAPNATEHFSKIRRWLDGHDVPFTTPEELAAGTVTYEQLLTG